jgi:hypothetical protein
MEPADGGDVAWKKRNKKERELERDGTNRQ